MRGPFGAEEDGVDVLACRFVAAHNALLIAGDLGNVFMDCYLHLGRAGVVLRDRTDELLKRSLAALALYAASRPRGETLAWTLHFEAKELNVFVAAENATGRLVGRVFGGNIRPVGTNVLHAEIADCKGACRRSSVDFHGDDPLSAAARFYEQSEQRPGRFVYLGGDRFAALVAQPDCDTVWLEKVTTREIGLLADSTEEIPLEERCSVFCCGCSPEKIAAAIGGALQGRLDEVYGEDTHVNVDCPRCGLRHELHRSLFV